MSDKDEDKPAKKDEPTKMEDDEEEGEGWEDTQLVDEDDVVVENFESQEAQVLIIFHYIPYFILLPVYV